MNIHYLLKCSYVHKVDGRNITSTLWLANISHLLEHQCKVWYGYPTEVWSKFEASESLLIPLLNIHSRVACVNTLILVVLLELTQFMLLLLYHGIIHNCDNAIAQMQCIRVLTHYVSCSSRAQMWWIWR